MLGSDEIINWAIVCDNFLFISFFVTSALFLIWCSRLNATLRAMLTSYKHSVNNHAKNNSVDNSFFLSSSPFSPLESGKLQVHVTRSGIIVLCVHSYVYLAEKKVKILQHASLEWKASIVWCNFVINFMHTN